MSEEPRKHEKHEEDTLRGQLVALLWFLGMLAVITIAPMIFYAAGYVVFRWVWTVAQAILRPIWTYFFGPL